MIKRIFWICFIFLLLINIIPLGDSANVVLHKKLFQDWELFRLDYLAHFAAFLALAGIVIWGQYLGKPVFRERAPLKFALLVIPAAIVFEALQFFVPFRKFSHIDMIYNLAGALIGTAVVSVLAKTAE